MSKTQKNAIVESFVNAKPMSLT